MALHVLPQAGRNFDVSSCVLESHNSGSTLDAPNIVVTVRLKACLILGDGANENTEVLAVAGPFKPQHGARASPGCASDRCIWRPCGAIALFHLLPGSLLPDHQLW